MTEDKKESAVPEKAVGKKRSKKGVIGINPLDWLDEEKPAVVTEALDTIIDTEQWPLAKDQIETTELTDSHSMDGVEDTLPGTSGSNDQTEQELEPVTEPEVEQVVHVVDDQNNGLEEEDSFDTVSELQADDLPADLVEGDVTEVENLEEGVIVAAESETLPDVDAVNTEKKLKDVNETVDIVSDEVDKSVSETELLDDMEHHDEDARMKLEGPVTIADVSELYNQFKDLIEKGEPLTIDCSQVESVDASALQLLTVVSHEASNLGIEIEWEQPSDSMISAAELLGLRDDIRL